MHLPWALAVVTPPASEPVTLSDAKDHLRVTHTSEDTLITALIAAAREQAEGFTKRALMTQTWDLSIDWNFPHVIEIPKPPLQSITSVKYIDSAGVEQTVDAADYVVDTKLEPGRVYPAFGEVWPTPRHQREAVPVRFVAGYADAASVPNSIKQAMLLMISHWYQHRETSLAGTSIMQIPMGAQALLGSHLVAVF